MDNSFIQMSCISKTLMSCPWLKEPWILCVCVCVCIQSACNPNRGQEYSIQKWSAFLSAEHLPNSLSFYFYSFIYFISVIPVISLTAIYAIIILRLLSFLFVLLLLFYCYCCYSARCYCCCCYYYCCCYAAPLCNTIERKFAVYVIGDVTALSGNIREGVLEMGTSFMYGSLS
jgi:hypothetical protein